MVSGRVLSLAQGDTYVMAFAPGADLQAFPELPVALTALSAERRAAGEDRFELSSQVRIPPLHLWSFIDVNRDFDPLVDVLAQPGRGDFWGEGMEVATPGEHVALDRFTALSSPAPSFQVAGTTAGETVVLPLQATLSTLVLEPVATPVEPQPGPFEVTLRDDDENGLPDDQDGDGLPDVSPRIVLRHLVPADNGGALVLPGIIDPTTLGPLLLGLTRTLELSSLRVLVPRIAAEVTRTPQGLAFVPTAVQVGEYELIVLSATGQLWRMPNDLGRRASRHGPAREDQAIRFRVE
jgi:hypothetical protein